MNKKIIFSGLMAVLVCAIVNVPHRVEASCSASGYYHSGGTCVSSFKHHKEKKHEYNSFNSLFWNDGYKHSTDVAYLQAYLYQLLMILSQYGEGGYDNSESDVSVRTLQATDINDESATLRAIVDMHGEDEAELYFTYGQSSGNLTRETETESLDESDDGDTISQDVTDLSEGTRYYYRAVVEDADGDKDYGSVNSFVTDGYSSSDDDEDEPDVTTKSALDIDTESAELRGTIDMNDYENGTAFFVYGEDEDLVSDVEDDVDSYADIDEDGDDLQKVLVDTDVDGYEDVYYDISGLDENTDIYFALCVEYDDDDDDETLTCGTTRSFETE